MLNNEGNIASSIPEWSLVQETTFVQTPSNTGSRKKRMLVKLSLILKNDVWNKIMLLVCVVGVSLDPLFFYIPTLDQGVKCVKLDKGLTNLALVLRSLTDSVYLMDIIFNVAKAHEAAKRDKPGLVGKKGQLVNTSLAVARRLSWSLFIVDFLAILPIPQVTILVILQRVGSLIRRWLDVLIISQYLPRILRIYLSCMELTRTQDELTRIMWVKGGFNFFLYILASHVFGGFWYLFSLKRVVFCWLRSCSDNHNENCESNIVRCSESSSRNIMSMNIKCPINPPNTTTFDFGIFLPALDSGVHSTDLFSQKLLNCFWWGLRNLSSFGQNLDETSSYTWEILFAICISISGLLLFLYLIGNLQTYIALATTKSEEIGEKMKLKERDVEVWIAKNGLPKDMKISIMEKVKHHLEENKDVDVENLLNILPRKDRKSIKRILFLPMLKKIPIFHNMDEQVLKVICDDVKPMIYNESSYMIREGDPLDRMLFITQGTAWAYKNTSSSTLNTICSHNSTTSSTSSTTTTKRLKKHDYVGEELLQWSLTHNAILDFPISTMNVKSHTKVEAFSLMANDLMNAVSRFWWIFRRNLPPEYSTNSHNGHDRWEIHALWAVKAFRRGIRNKKKMKNLAHLIDNDHHKGGKSKIMKYQRLKH